MFEYIKGELIEIKPTHAIIENSQIAYFVNISLFSYTQINGLKEVQLYIHHIIREDFHALYGFADRSERDMFRHLISVSGIGANTARMMLSSMSPNEVKHAIVNGQVAELNRIKGIGAKTAQRIIVDLSDKLGRSEESENIFIGKDNTLKEEALSALIMLGFAKKQSEKVVEQIIKLGKFESIEEVVKEALKRL